MMENFSELWSWLENESNREVSLAIVSLLTTFFGLVGAVWGIRRFVVKRNGKIEKTLSANEVLEITVKALVDQKRVLDSESDREKAILKAQIIDQFLASPERLLRHQSKKVKSTLARVPAEISNSPQIEELRNQKIDHYERELIDSVFKAIQEQGNIPISIGDDLREIPAFLRRQAN